MKIKEANKEAEKRKQGSSLLLVKKPTLFPMLTFGLLLLREAGRCKSQGSYQGADRSRQAGEGGEDCTGEGSSGRARVSDWRTSIGTGSIGTSGGFECFSNWRRSERLRVS